MEYINDFNFTTEYECIVTFGKFDGLHIGHKLLIDEALKIAKKTGYKVVMCTFDMRKWMGNKISQITSNLERQMVAEKLGIDVLIEIPFDDYIADMSPEEFVNEIITGKLHAKYVIVGNDWHFGKNRAGDTDLLKALQEKYSYTAVIIDKITLDGNEISSTWIREELAKGNMPRVKELLGYDYFFLGEIVHGKQLGRTLDFPTINQKPEKHKVMPPFGVYTSVVEIDGIQYKGITNIGKRPTVDNSDDISVETFILDFKRDVYGKLVKVSITGFIREEKKFASVEELKKQIEYDIGAAFGLHENSSL